MNRKFLVIGGSRGIGREITRHFKGKSLSRTDGYDIRDAASRKKIAQLSLSYDVTVNHAYCGDFSQMEMLRELCFLWMDQKKTGYIINTGSISSYRFHGSKDKNWWAMAGLKKGLDEFINYMSHAAAWRQDVKFRITNIRPGMLDTERARKKPHFKAGVKGSDYCRLIEYLIGTPEDLIISEIVLEAKCPVSASV